MATIPQLTPLRYETSTVTLEVIVREAAVSQWSDQPVVQILRYQLQVRSPNGVEEFTEIGGDRASFLPLIEAVQSYIQAQLTGNDNGVYEPSPDALWLQSAGLTQHVLHLGRLHTTTGAKTISLGAIQLADLADIVEQLDTQIRPLPVTLAPKSRLRSWQQWGTIAASMVATIGVTTALWSTYQSPQATSETALESTESETAIPQIESAPQQVERSPATLETLEETETSDAIVEQEDTAADLPNNISGERNLEAVNGETRSEGTVKSRPSIEEPQRSAQDRITIKPAPRATASPSPSSLDSASEPTSESFPQAEIASPQTELQPPAISSSSPTSAVPTPGSAEPLEDGLNQNPSAANRSPADNGEDFEASMGQQPVPSTAVPETHSVDEFTLSQIPEERGNEPLLSLSLEDLMGLIGDRWPPPDPPSQMLMYTLTLDAEGILANVEPSDNLSTEYRNLTGIPEPGTAQFPAGTPSVLKVLLQPSGAVDIMNRVPE